jgi:hypothetical protein
MVDDSGRTFSNPGEPLHICVDTDKPTAKLSIEMDHYGDLNARISISDQNLDQASITLDFQIEDFDDWEPISIYRNRGTAVIGQATALGAFLKPLVKSRCG